MRKLEEVHLGGILALGWGLTQHEREGKCDGCPGISTAWVSTYHPYPPCLCASVRWLEPGRGGGTSKHLLPSPTCHLAEGPANLPRRSGEVGPLARGVVKGDFSASCSDSPVGTAAVMQSPVCNMQWMLNLQGVCETS